MLQRQNTTKLLLFLLTLFVLIEISADADAAQRRRSSRSRHSSSTLNYGFASGIDISFLAPESGSSSNSTLGFFGGGFAEYHFSDNIGVQADLGFLKFGGEKVSSSLLFAPSSFFLENVKTVDLNMYGVEIPVVAKYHITSLDPEFYFCLGASGTYIMKAQAALNKQSTLGQMVSSNTTYVDVTKKVQSMQACGVFGCGTSIPIGGVHLQINFTFNYGLTDLSANNVASNNGFKSKYLKIGAAIQF